MAIGVTSTTPLIRTRDACSARGAGSPLIDRSVGLLMTRPSANRLVYPLASPRRIPCLKRHGPAPPLVTPDASCLWRQRDRCAAGREAYWLHCIDSPPDYIERTTCRCSELRFPGAAGSRPVRPSRRRNSRVTQGHASEPCLTGAGGAIRSDPYVNVLQYPRRFTARVPCHSHRACSFVADACGLGRPAARSRLGPHLQDRDAFRGPPDGGPFSGRPRAG